MPANPYDSLPTQKHMDIASSIQKVIELILVKIVKNVFEEYKCENLCLAGGVALNCVANSVLLKETQVKKIWIQPAAGDAGGSIGAALGFWHEFLNKKRKLNGKDQMKNTYLGPSYNDSEVKVVLEKYQAISFGNEKIVLVFFISI